MRLVDLPCRKRGRSRIWYGVLWLVTALLFFNAWLLGFLGFLLAAVGPSLTALSATDDGRAAVRVGAVIAALVLWGILSALALAMVLRLEYVFVIEFVVCSAVYAYVLLADPR
jgi:hypothetical protein